MGCLLEKQERRLSPRNAQYPEVERLVSGHPPQSASVYDIKEVVDE
jgi:hypothetical protein